MKSTAELVLEYIDSIPLGEFVSRKDIYDYACKVKDVRGRSTVDCYKRILQLNNIISEPTDTLGIYVKINPVPEGITMNELKERSKFPMNPYYKNKTTGIFTLTQEILADNI